MVVQAWSYLAVYAAVAAWEVAAGDDAPLVYWIVPMLLGQPALRAFLLAEHTGCPLVADMAANTLTTAAVRLLGWNMPFHTEHDLYPAVPFHALPPLHSAIRDRLTVVWPGYRAAHREIGETLT